MMLLVVGGVTCWTIKPKRAEELGPASLADLKLATGTRPSWPHLQSPVAEGTVRQAQATCSSAVAAIGPSARATAIGYPTGA